MYLALHPQRAVPFVACLLLAVACRQNDLMPPGPPENIEVLSGEAQQSTVAEALPNQLAVKVVDANDRGVPEIAVIFEAAAGSGSATPSQVTTDANGIARTTWTMPTVAGQAKSLEARAANGGGSSPHILLHATALPAAATGLRLTTEPETFAESGIALMQSLPVQIVDKYDNAVPQADVVIAVAVMGNSSHLLGGTISTLTDRTGRALFCLTIYGPPELVTLTFTTALLSSATSTPINLLPATNTNTPRITCG